ncbi:MAG: hypothetical protein MJA82_12210 [Clostridia bacterium]|nr:hypothetical protein [Clostridia bacterium]
MKKTLLFITILVVINITILGCQQQKINELPQAKVQLNHRVYENNIHYFDWYVENVSKNEEQKLTFSNGNIINYEIRNHASNKKYGMEYDKKHENSVIVLEKGESHKETIIIEKLDKGHYSAKFWAISEEGINPIQVISFDID